MVFWLRDLATAWLLAPWFIALVVLGSLRFAFAHLVRRHFSSRYVLRWERGYAFLTGATGLVWGMMAWMPIADPDHSKLFVIVVMLFCILLVSGITLMASSLALTSFAVALALPLLARTLTLEARLALLFGLGLAMMAWVMISAVRSHRQTLISAMLGRNEVDELLQQQKVVFESAGEGIVFLKPKAIAARLRDAVRDADTVARMGGDEFVVLLPDVDQLDDAVKVANKIHDRFCEPIADGNTLHTVGTSIGISVFPDHGKTPDTLLHRADHAMYNGKSRGGKTTRIYDVGTLN